MLYRIRQGRSISVGGIEYKEGQLVDLSYSDAAYHAESIEQASGFPEDGFLPIRDSAAIVQGEDLALTYYLALDDEIKILEAAGQELTTEEPHRLANNDRILLFFQSPSALFKTTVTVTGESAFTVPDTIPASFGMASFSKPSPLSAISGQCFDLAIKTQSYTTGGILATENGEKVAILTCSNACANAPNIQSGDFLHCLGVATQNKILSVVEECGTRRETKTKLLIEGAFTQAFSGDDFYFTREAIAAEPGAVFPTPSLTFSGDLTYGEITLNIDKADFAGELTDKILRIFSNDDLIAEIFIGSEK